MNSRLVGFYQANGFLFTPVPTPPYGQVFVIFFVFFWPYIMVMCVLKRILHKKKSIFLQVLESRIPPLTAAARRMTICKRPAPHFDHHEKCIFETLHNEMKCVLSVKESNFNEKKIKIFTFAYGQGWGGWPPPPCTVSLTVKYPFFWRLAYEQKNNLCEVKNT